MQHHAGGSLAGIAWVTAVEQREPRRDGRQRIAQFVREHRKKLVDAVVRFAQIFCHVAQILLGLPEAQQRARDGDQLLVLEGVGEVAVGAALEALDLELGRDEHRRGVQHLDVAGVRIALQPSAEIETAHVGQPDVQHDEPWLTLARDVDRFGTGARFRDIEACPREYPAHGVAGTVMVVDVEYG
jgi:hypothetical protein